jgi:hypothetical protein
MITKSARQGLVVSTRSQATGALNELISGCGWPALLQATPQQFRRAVLLGVPEFSLFWLDDERDVAITIRLLAWLKAYLPAVRRIAVGYRLPTHVEVAIRSGGAHVYLTATDDIRALLDGPIAQWLCREVRRDVELSERPFAVDASKDSPASHGIVLNSSGPP